MGDEPVTWVNGTTSDCVEQSLAAESEAASTKSSVVGTGRQRRVRTSAAMIGLAISMGASNLLLTKHNSAAMAAEPLTAEATSATTLPVVEAVTTEAEVNTAGAGVNQEQAALPTPEFSGVRHTVQEGESLWGIAQIYNVDSGAIAADNSLAPGTTLRVGQVLQIPGNADQLLKAKQDAALNQLHQKRQELQASISKLKSLDSSESNSSAPVGVIAYGTPLPVSESVSASTSTELTTAAASTEVTQPQVQVPAQSAPVVSRNAESLYAMAQPSSATTSELTTILPSATTAAPLVPAKPEVATPNVTLPTPAVAESNDVKVASIGLNGVIAPSETPKVVSTSIYRVQRGDTLELIARRHGLTRADILAVNRISDPNWIFVGQEIAIPQVNQVATAIATPTEVKVASRTVVPSPMLEAVAPDATPSESFPVPNSLAPQAAKSEAPVNVAVAPVGPGYADPAQINPSVPTEPQFSPYIQRLKQDIVRLQERYQSANPSVSSTTAPVQAAVPATVNSVVPPTVSATPTVNPLPQQQAVNPEFTSDQRLQALRSQVERLQERPLASTLGTSVRPNSLQSGNGQLVAAAPSGAESYDPLIQSMLGRAVSPDLPPLASPDRYLPDSTSFEGYIWPTRGVLTSGFGWRWGRMHRGIDIAAPIGTPVVAAADGVVVTAGWNSGGYGYLVEIRHADGSLTLYAHNNRILVQEGQRVAQGQQISEMGSTGYSTGPHLHFEVHPAGQGAVNPMAFLARAGG